MQSLGLLTGVVHNIQKHAFEKQSTTNDLLITKHLNQLLQIASSDNQAPQSVIADCRLQITSSDNQALQS
jgi:hypothetical protein